MSNINYEAIINEITTADNGKTQSDALTKAAALSQNDRKELFATLFDKMYDLDIPIEPLFINPAIENNEKVKADMLHSLIHSNNDILVDTAIKMSVEVHNVKMFAEAIKEAVSNSEFTLDPLKEELSEAVDVVKSYMNDDDKEVQKAKRDILYSLQNMDISNFNTEDYEDNDIEDLKSDVETIVETVNKYIQDTSDAIIKDINDAITEKDSGAEAVSIDRFDYEKAKQFASIDDIRFVYELDSRAEFVNDKNAKKDFQNSDKQLENEHSKTSTINR